MRSSLFVLFIKYVTGNQINYVKTGRYCSIFGKMSNTSDILVQKSNEKRSLRRLKKYHDNIIVF
jgi:hypothetical protein